VGNKVALIAGPTASGKSDLAVRLALALQHSGKPAVVINADSAQVYADLAVLSARPSAEEMHGVPHRLFGAWDGAQACSAADWATAAKVEIAAVHAAGAVPVLVGGTGLYIRTLLDGIAPVPGIDDQVRAEVRGMDTAAIHAALLAEDPPYAARLNAADRQRLSRALEVVRSTGKSLTAWHGESAGGIAADITLAPLVLLPERPTLYARCDARFARMLGQGAVAEVETLLARGLDPALPVMTAIGVREIAAWLRGEWSQEEAITKGQQATRNYAKRQYTWLRHQPPAEWARIEPENVSIANNFEILF
jgi:tRNA dimethylallyltransferase